MVISLIQKYKVYIKYLISGGTAATTDLALIFLFTSVFGIWYLLSAVIAFVFAFGVSFVLQKFWTFRNNEMEQIKKQLAMYLSLSLFNLIINTGAMYVLVDIIGWHYFISQIIIAASIAIFSFFVYNLVIFKKEKAVISV